MAARASKDAVQRAVDGPDFEGALGIINSRIADAKTAQGQASKRAATAWGDIEKMGVNKQGAQMFARVQKIEDEDERQDQLRTFYKLCQLEGIGIETDLVDIAQGSRPDPVPTVNTAVQQPAAKSDPVMATDAETVALADGAEPMPTEKLAEKAQRKPPALKAVEGGKSAQDKAKAHLSGKPAVPDATD